MVSGLPAIFHFFMCMVLTQISPLAARLGCALFYMHALEKFVLFVPTLCDWAAIYSFL